MNLLLRGSAPPPHPNQHLVPSACATLLYRQSTFISHMPTKSRLFEDSHTLVLYTCELPFRMPIAFASDSFSVLIDSCLSLKYLRRKSHSP